MFGNSKRLERIEKLLAILIERNRIMHEELTAYLVRIDKATNEIAARLTELLKDQPLPADIKAKFDAEVAALEALGKTP